MKAKALHEQIRADIEGQILSGTIRPGDRLPPELELMEVYNCSRMTVSKALSRLSDTGLIRRRKRAGTVVVKPSTQSMVLDVPDLPTEITRRGQIYHYRLVDKHIRKPAKGDADEKQLAGKGTLLFVKGVHHADGQPFAYEERLVSLAMVPGIADADFTTAPPGSWLLEHIPWTEAENRIGAAAATGECAALLGLPEGGACLLVERRTWRARDNITHVRQYFIAGSYELVARFGADQSRK